MEAAVRQRRGRRRRRAVPAVLPLLFVVTDASRLDRSTISAPGSKNGERNLRGRHLQGGGLSFGGNVGNTDALASCYADLVSSDSDLDGYISPSRPDEYVSFVQAMADGALDETPWGTPIASYLDLSMSYPQFTSVYNQFACGNANVGCPAVPGIDISGLDEVVDGSAKAEDAVGNEAGLIQLCNAVRDEVGKLAPPPPAPVPTTDKPTVTPSSSTNGPTKLTYAPTVSGFPTSSTYEPTVTAFPTTIPPVVPGVPGDVVTPAPSPAPTTPAPVTPAGPPACPERFDKLAEYGAGDTVINPPGLFGGEKAIVYQCRGFPYSEWCYQPGYEPGVDLNYDQAWETVGSCIVEGGDESGGDGKTDSPTVSPAASIPEGDTPSPTPSPVASSDAPTKVGGLVSEPPVVDGGDTSPSPTITPFPSPSTYEPTITAYPTTFYPTPFDYGEVPDLTAPTTRFPTSSSPVSSSPVFVAVPATKRPAIPNPDIGTSIST